MKIKVADKIESRIKFINNTIFIHKQNIEALLHYQEIFKSKKLCLEYKTTIPRSEHVFNFTLKNLNEQIAELETELKILNQYRN